MCIHQYNPFAPNTMQFGFSNVDIVNMRNRVFPLDISYGSSLDLCGFAPFPSPSSTVRASICCGKEKPKTITIPQAKCYRNDKRKIKSISSHAALPVANPITEENSLIVQTADGDPSNLGMRKKRRNYLLDNKECFAQDPINKLVAAIHFLQKWNASLCRADMEIHQNIQKSRNEASRNACKQSRERSKQMHRATEEELRKRRNEGAVQALHEKEEFSIKQRKTHDKVRHENQATRRRRQEISRCNEQSLHLSNRMISLTSKQNHMFPTNVSRSQSRFPPCCQKGPSIKTKTSDVQSLNDNRHQPMNHKIEISVQRYPADCGALIVVNR